MGEINYRYSDAFFDKYGSTTTNTLWVTSAAKVYASVL